MEIPDKNPLEILFAKEYWTGDSRDGTLVNGDGYHYYRMQLDGLILEALKETARPLVVGLVTSVHCVGMCGPIGCGLSAMPASECWP